MNRSYILAAAALIATPAIAQGMGSGAQGTTNTQGTRSTAPQGADTMRSQSPSSMPERAMSSSGMGGMPTQAMSPREYVMMAGASDLYERQSSQLVMQSTKNPMVRDFANMMIANHTKSTADVTAAARQARVPVMPPRLNADQTRMMVQLRAARGPARDMAYISQQKTAHDMALNLHQSYAMNGSAEPLKAAAGMIVPAVQQHIQMLQTMPGAMAM